MVFCDHRSLLQRLDEQDHGVDFVVFEPGAFSDQLTADVRTNWSAIRNSLGILSQARGNVHVLMDNANDAEGPF